MIRGAILACVVAACAGPADPCAGEGDVCVHVRVTSTAIARVDQLELDVLYDDGTFSTATTTTPTVDLPVTTGIAFAAPPPSTIQVVIAGRLADQVVGTGYGATTVGSGDPLAIDLEPVADPCIPGGAYCGGDKVTGDPSTLYRCGAQGVGYARGACVFGCTVGVGRDDACYGGGERCVTGTAYCGGDKLAGDPSLLYTCQANGTGVLAQTCANGCAIVAGHPDRCR